MSNVLVIDGVRIVDGTGLPPVENGRVVIENGRIFGAGPQATVPAPPGATTFDGKGKTALPGLIDMHVHDPSDANMALYVRSGVTSIRFAGGDQPALLDLRRRIEDGAIRGPRIFSCGSGVDATPHAWPGSHAADSPIEARRLVRRMIETERVDAILATHRMTRATLGALTEEAHRFGVPVTGQLWAASARDAVAAGMDGLENTSRIPEADGFGPERLHARPSVSGRLATLAHLWDEAEAGRLAEIAGLLAEHAVALAPELVSFEAWAGISASEVKADAEYPGDARDPRAVQYDRHSGYISSEWTPEDRAAQARAIDKFKEFCRIFHRAGGPLVTGTDLGFGGILLHRELRHFVDLGLTASEAIRAATRQAASALGRDDLGFLQAGRAADLIVVAGNPLVDLGALRQVELALVNGRTAFRA